jgi:hypothetical protein
MSQTFLFLAIILGIIHGISGCSSNRVSPSNGLFSFLFN